MSLLRLCLIGLHALLLAAGSAPLSHAAGDPPSDAQIKAAIIYNFAKYTAWPEGAFESAGSALRICILGHDRESDALAAFQAKTVQGHPVDIQRVEQLAELRRCHMIYFASARNGALQSSIRALEGLPILTVSGVDGFHEAGGMIALFEYDNRVRFDINLRPAQRAGLQLSSQVLKLARKVID